MAVTLSAQLELFSNVSKAMDQMVQSTNKATGSTEQLRAVVQKDLTPNIDNAKISVAHEKLNTYVNLQKMQASAIDDMYGKYDQASEAYLKISKSLDDAIAKQKMWQDTLKSNPANAQAQIEYEIMAKNIERIQIAQSKAGQSVGKLEEQIAKAEIQNIKYAEGATKAAESLDRLSQATDKVANNQTKASQSQNKMEQGAKKAAGSQNSLNQSMKNGKSSADALTGKIKRLVTAYLGFRAIKSLISNIMKIADSYTTADAQLTVINDGLRTQKELQDQVYAAAQRSKTSYATMADTMSKFSMVNGMDNSQAARMTESMMKVVKISGKKGGESFAQQMALAMAKGEVNSRFINSMVKDVPYLGQILQEHFGKALPDIAAMIDKGKISVSDLANVLIKEADKIDKRFKSLPTTFEDIKTVAGNSFGRIVQAMGQAGMPLDTLNQKLQDFLSWLETPPGLDFLATLGGMLNGLITTVSTLFGWIASGAAWASENLGLVIPVLIGVGAAIAAVTAAQWAMNLAMLANPIGLVILLITALIAGLIILGVKIYQAQEKFKIMSSNFAKAMGNMARIAGNAADAIVMAINGMVNSVIMQINLLIRGANKIGGIFGKNAIEEITYKVDTNAGRGDRWAKTVEGSINGASDWVLDKVTGVGDKITDAFGATKDLFSTVPTQLDGISANVAPIPDVIAPSGGGGGGGGGKAVRTKDTNKEDTELLKFMAEWGKIQAVNYQITLQPQVSLSNNEFNMKTEVDVDDIADVMGQKLIDESETMIAQAIGGV